MAAQDVAIADYQRRQARANQKSTSHHYSSLEDSVPGFRIEPPAVAMRGPATLQTGGGFGPTWYNRRDQRAVSRASSSVRASASHLNSQRSYAQSRGTDLHPSSSAATNANSRYNRLDVAEPDNAVGRRRRGRDSKGTGSGCSGGGWSAPSVAGGAVSRGLGEAWPSQAPEKTAAPHVLAWPGYECTVGSLMLGSSLFTGNQIS